MNDETAILDRYGVIGYPVAHSKSPTIHKLFAEQTDQHLSYELLEVPPSKLEQAVRQFQRSGGRGLNITVPHKARATRLVDELSEEASIAGAVNTLKIDGDRVVGHNTDGIGLVRDLVDNWQMGLTGKRLLILGAGGATQGILGPLLELEPRQTTIANRTVSKASALANHFGALGDVEAKRFVDIKNVEPYDLIINATSAGLGGETPPFPRDAVDSRRTACYDLSYAFSVTPFIAWAKQVDAAKTRSGWGMLIEQAAESFHIWRGIRPDSAAVIKQLPVN
ncbi:MAG: shikimate dehydrogenase [Pseudomonadota bacterium]